MYVPRPFAVDSAEADALLSDLVVGQLITSTPAGPMATFVPWVLSVETRALVGHIARSNPQWQTPWVGQAMVLAQGPDGYVSPGWYPSKAEHGRVVPTWNYVSLQVFGELIVHDDALWVGDVVRRLTDRHEAHRPVPWAVDDAPVEYVDAQLQGIVGVELRIERIEAAIKMSQNKGAADSSGVIAGFTAEGNVAVADLVRSRVTPPAE